MLSAWTADGHDPHFVMSGGYWIGCYDRWTSYLGFLAGEGGLQVISAGGGLAFTNNINHGASVSESLERLKSDQNRSVVKSN